MQKQFITTVLLLMGFCLVACRTQEPTQELSVVMDDSSRVIIDRAINYAGGWDAWQQKKTLSFDKKTISYDSTGAVAREIDQHFDYMIRPQFRAKVSYLLHDTTVTLLHDGQQARKLFNGTASGEQKDVDNAWNSSFGSQYVMCMPYKLKDPGIKAEYIGEVTLDDGVPAQVVKTSYVKGAGSNPDHVWYYYFEPGSGKLLANSLNGKDNYWDYTRYTEFERIDGLLLPALRKGYAADSLNRPGRQTSQSRHSHIVFNKEFAEDHFRLPSGN